MLFVGCSKNDDYTYCYDCGEKNSGKSKYCCNCGISLIEENKNLNIMESHTVENKSTTDYYTDTTSKTDLNLSSKELFETKTTINKMEEEIQTTKSSEIKCFSLGCNNPQKNCKFYCEEHACKIDSCSGEKTYDSNYCNMHKCGSFACDNHKIELEYYCSEHMCKAGGCMFEKTFLKEYCSMHECKEVECNNERSSLGFYCDEHTCKKSGCTSKNQYYQIIAWFTMNEC